MSKCSVIEVLVGILVSAAVIAIGSFMVSKLSNKARFNAKCSTITAAFADVDGLRVGSDVRVSGVSVGSVTSLHLNRQNTPVVKMCIAAGLMLPVDSSAAITYSDIMGGKYIDIVPGAADNVLGNGSQIKHTSTVVSLHTIIDKMINSALRENAH
ncbi:outer membrane lipid asymmetry maintenance protein MlaD [Candidatus Anaplasma sp. TIGMIC]|uniref:outer membrane lipid asymmetry maintenance protein MlaD n=1 Tax=Candidatus Anaplasma sp. TIGMIC TaxID=3020713 RepID=UPI00232CC625|nr:outer membrane lipid asymmetry maintenance protein MlaD [Candidatus Anaplasma sp. TIGMIC]MDB1135338.1 outer membrane lipid asymmetry maintenance protein MlaD [Candidatus Anaplasma sp. TIGMIC]